MDTKGIGRETVAAMATGDSSDCFAGFQRVVADWFRDRYGEPTEAQSQSWPLIKRGLNVLIHSPTGSGKTLAAFLSAIDTAFAGGGNRSARSKGVKVLYISPLRALNYDIERNLREPLAGISEVFLKRGDEVREVSVAVRTGDTSSADRARMVRNPPDFLITTPESLYLILTSPRARDVLRSVETVIVDEIHTMCSNKRGVHLSVSMERLECLSPGFQRIGLSATQRPLSEVSRLLGGQHVNDGEVGQFREIEIVDCGGRSGLDVQVVGMPESDGAGHADSVWRGVIPRVLDDIECHDTTLVFTNSRRQAENTADRLNQVLVARDAGIDEGSSVGGGDRGSGISDGPFMAHHGSIADETRRQIEGDLKAGKLPALVGTSSLELGIDIGSIDLVVQLQSPKSVAQGLQRVGRAGHQVGATSRAKIYATHPEDLLESAVVAKGMLDGEIETMRIPSNALDVLAQHVVSAVSLEDWKVSDLYDVVRGAYPYRELEYSTFESVVRLVSGHYPRKLFRTLRARLHWDRARDVLCALPGTRMAAIGNAGAIVDRGAFKVVLGDRKTTVGELDEEFVYESSVGDVFVLGSQVWRATDIDDDRVVAEPAPGSLPRMPFWRGEYPWRPPDLGLRYGRFRSEVGERLLPYVDDDHDPAEVLDWLTRDYPLDEAAARQVIGHVREQLRSCGAISSDKAIVVERYEDGVGDWRIVVHSPYGGRVNGPWCLAVVKEITDRGHLEPEYQVNDDGFMLRLPASGETPPLEVISELTPEVVKRHILDGLIDSPMFGATFRQNASRSMLMPSVGFGKRTPFWLQRLRSKDLLSVARGLPDFPVLLETYRDVMEDVMDLPTLIDVIGRINAGEIEVVHVESRLPSPVAKSLDFRFVDHWMYQWDTPNAERAMQRLSADRDALISLFQEPGAAGLLRSEAFDGTKGGEIEGALVARSATELSQMLLELGDMSTEEISRCAEDGCRDWLAMLREQERVMEFEFPLQDGSGARRWIATEDIDLYQSAFSGLPDLVAMSEVLARYVIRMGVVSESALHARYPVAWSLVTSAVDLQLESGSLARGYFTSSGEMEVMGVSKLEEVRARTLGLLRSDVEPVPPLRYQREVLSLHGVGVVGEGGDHVLRTTIHRLQGLSFPVSAWSSEIFPARVSGFSVNGLDSLLRAGDAYWIFTRNDAVTELGFVMPNSGSVVLSDAMLRQLRGFDASDLEPRLRRVYEFIAAEGVVKSSDIGTSLGDVSSADLSGRLVELARRGLITCDSWSVAQAIANWTGVTVREVSNPVSRPTMRSVGHRRRGLRREFMRRHQERRGVALPDARWSATDRFAMLGPQVGAMELAGARADMLLGRHGVVARHALREDGLDWDWGPIYDELNLRELRGTVRRGYFVSGLGGVQFASNEFVERLRDSGPSDGSEARGYVVVTQSDPACVLRREMLETDGSLSSDLLLRSKAGGATVVWWDRPVLVSHANCSRVYAVADAGREELVGASRALIGHSLRSGGTRRVTVREWDGEQVLGTPGAEILSEVGLRRDYPYMVGDALTLRSMESVYH